MASPSANSNKRVNSLAVEDVHNIYQPAEKNNQTNVMAAEIHSRTNNHMRREERISNGRGGNSNL